jgi:hypothetical protein
MKEKRLSVPEAFLHTASAPRAGFTLVEMLVACALLAFTGVAVASALFAIALANELAGEREARPSGVLPVLAADAEAAFVPSGLADGESAMTLANGDGDPLAPLFSWHLHATDAAACDGVSGGCGSVEVSYLFSRERTGQAPELVRVVTRSSAEPVTNLLLSGEWRLGAEVFAENGTAWTEWPPKRTEGDDPPALPCAIRFTLSGDGYETTRLATVFAASAVAAK